MDAEPRQPAFLRGPKEKPGFFFVQFNMVTDHMQPLSHPLLRLCVPLTSLVGDKAESGWPTSSGQ